MLNWDRSVFLLASLALIIARLEARVVRLEEEEEDGQAVCGDLDLILVDELNT